MKAQDLRIGNFVMCVFEPHQITSIVTRDNGIIGFETGGYGDESDDIKPIELTEEWILKFGFIKELDGVFSKYRNNYKSDTSKVSIQWVDYFATEESYSGYVFFYGKFYDGDFIWINHVHQLQNLYYLITGKELIN
jgi:hypothetical protein